MSDRTIKKITKEDDSHPDYILLGTKCSVSKWCIAIYTRKEADRCPYLVNLMPTGKGIDYITCAACNSIKFMVNK